VWRKWKTETVQLMTLAMASWLRTLPVMIGLLLLAVTTNQSAPTSQRLDALFKVLD